MHSGAYRDSGMYTFTHCDIGSNIGHVSCFDCVGLVVVSRLVGWCWFGWFWFGVAPGGCGCYPQGCGSAWGRLRC
jgi:hypothetical protein